MCCQVPLSSAYIHLHRSYDRKSIGWVNWTRTVTFTHTFSNDTLYTQLFCNNNSSLLPDDQRSRVRVRGDVARADRQVGDFETTNAIHVQTRIDDTASLARLHRASTELSKCIPPKKEKGEISNRTHYHLIYARCR